MGDVIVDRQGPRVAGEIDGFDGGKTPCLVGAHRRRRVLEGFPGIESQLAEPVCEFMILPLRGAAGKDQGGLVHVDARAFFGWCNGRGHGR